MCILFIYHNSTADIGSYKFILASNRDEFYNRPAKVAHFWEKHPECIGGMDMEPGKEGGTWLAMSRKGRIGVLLNLVGEFTVSNIPRKGRGFLVPEYIISSDSTLTFLNKLHKVNQETQVYNPYTLVAAELRTADVYCLSSSYNADVPQCCNKDKILGFGNSKMECPYKKVEDGKKQFESIVTDANISKQENLIGQLLQFLKSEERHLPDPELVKRDPTYFAELSSIFVRNESAQYGTRTHTIILVDTTNKVTFIEETLMPDKCWHYKTFVFMLE